MSAQRAPAPPRPSPKSIVRKGWDQISATYRPDGSTHDVFGHHDREYEVWLRPFFDRLPAGARLLDLGCGSGMPADRLLARRFRVTGVDLSEVQVERAERFVPEAEFLRADMTEVAFPDLSFDGIISLYAIIHVPLEEQPALLGRVHRWLRSGGLFLVTTGAFAWTGVEENWLGSRAAMFWSHADASTYERWFREPGFDILSRVYVPEGESGHSLFLARKPSARETSP